jgi:hypothetical protein
MVGERDEAEFLRVWIYLDLGVRVRVRVVVMDGSSGVSE